MYKGKLISFFENRKVYVYLNGIRNYLGILDLFDYGVYYEIISSERVDTYEYYLEIRNNNSVIKILHEWDYSDFNNELKIIDGCLVEFQKFPSYELIEKNKRRNYIINSILKVR